MDLTNLSAMLERMRRAVAKQPMAGPAVPFLALLKDYILPAMEEFEGVLQQTAVRLTDFEDLLDDVGDKADAALIAARQTLAGELFQAVAVNIEAMRVELLRLGLSENQVLMGVCNDIESAVYTFAQYLSEDEALGDDEGEEEEEEGGMTEGGNGDGGDGDGGALEGSGGTTNPPGVLSPDDSASQGAPEGSPVEGKADAT